ncbi:ANTAR domain-containing protein [Streptomyces sp. NPDC054863]
MTARGGNPEPVVDQAEAARRRAAAATLREERQMRLAERHERLAEETDQSFHDSMARTHRKVAARHREAARLQEAFARRAAQWSEGRGARPVFMAEVADACGSRSVALTLTALDLTHLAVAASDQRARDAQNLEYVLGDGPASEAVGGRHVVTASGPAVELRWPGYGAGLSGLGLSAVAALPLTEPSGCIGVLTVFDPRPGLVESGALDELAATLTEGVLLGPDADRDLYGGADLRVIVHQAAGLLSEQARCSVGDALALIKARAFAVGESAESVAEQIVSGSLRLPVGRFGVD